MTTNWNNIDSIIFDMDGTLWDAVDSYSKIWNVCSAEFGITEIVTREDILGLMGKPIDQIFKVIFGNNCNFDNEKYIARLDELEEEMMPILGGTPYPHMAEGIKELSQKYRIILLSNCGKSGLNNFMAYTGITKYITDSITFGETLKQKNENIKTLIARNNLQSAIYVGDTQSDCDQTRIAGIPFVHAAYGFGPCEKPDLSFKSFKELSDYFLNLKTV